MTYETGDPRKYIVARIQQTGGAMREPSQPRSFRSKVYYPKQMQKSQANKWKCEQSTARLAKFVHRS